MGGGLPLSPFPRLRGKAGMGARRSERLQDRGNNALDIAKHVVVPEPHDAIAFLRQELAASAIRCRVCMLPAIDFNDEALLEADEIGHERADRVLAPKAVPVQLSLPEMAPKVPLGIGHVAAELAGEIAFLAFAHPCAP